MSHHLTGNSRHTVLTRHAVLGAVLLACALILIHAPFLWPAVGAVAATAVAVHVGIAVVVHLGLGLAGAGALKAAVGSHAHPSQGDAGALGATIHGSRFYDWMVAAYTLGREGRMRQRTLDVAGVAVGDSVLDVGCGTGTLALAAKRRVGFEGSVHGVDASREMVARARAKSERSGLPVAFEIAAAQSLPFADGTFDVVTCSLAFHHLPEDSRAAALAEMRRVVKPGGRVLVVEFTSGHGALTLLNPIALVHARKSPRLLDEAADLLRRADFESVVTGRLGFGGLGYALARCAEPR
jgi:ubiquinone/menaquinone biosynthesis C-methylase UbiE